MNPSKTKLLKTLIETDTDTNPTIATASSATVPYLPDNIIEKILSFLPLNLAAEANTVSKQWASLWPSFPVIDFDEVDPIFSVCPIRRSWFLGVLHHSIRRCRNQRLLQKLRLRIRYEHEFVVDDWVDFAMERCVKELDLCFFGEDFDFLIDHYVLTSKYLVTLKLEKVRIYASAEIINGPVNLPSLKSMSLSDVLFIDDEGVMTVPALPSLISGCPSIEHLSIDRCILAYSSQHLTMSSESLKSLEIMNCHSKFVALNTKNLESFKYYLDCTCPDHGHMYLLECDKLKHVDISCTGLKRLQLHNCFETMENSFFTPKLEMFLFSGYLKGKIHFVEAPSKFKVATVRVWETLWSFEHYSALRDFLQSFDCSEKVKIHIEDAEGVTVPEHWRMEWSPPLPSIKQLQLYFSGSLDETDYCLRSSLMWMAPSAEILPILDHDDDTEDDFDDDDTEDDIDDDEDDDDDE